MKFVPHIVALSFANVALLGGTALASLPDLIPVSFQSKDAQDSLVFASLKKNGGESARTVRVGKGKHLWVSDPDSPDGKRRGWMYRFRSVMQAISDEYQRRGKEDFIALVMDAEDVFLPENLSGNALEKVKEKFLGMTHLKENKIVFGGQVYCCNPFQLSPVARREFDNFYEDQEQIKSIYKHINAGLYIGYASAILEMAREIGIWERDFHPEESYYNLMKTQAAEVLRMEDIEVDDDEWQIAAWFFRDQKKKTPLAAIDYYQDLLAITQTERAKQHGDEFLIFSRDEFARRFGSFPASFSLERLDELSVCPYTFDEKTMEWTNTITGSHPLVFHFAGLDWLCGCKLLSTAGFDTIPSKFEYLCRDMFHVWHDRIVEHVHYASTNSDAAESIVVGEKSVEYVDTDIRRKLDWDGDDHHNYSNNPAPPSEAGTGGGLCFSGETTVNVKGKGIRRMDELSVGDSVLQADGSYAKVYSFGHLHLTEKVPYLQIHTTDKSSIEISAEHLIYGWTKNNNLSSNNNNKPRHSPSLTPAGRLQVGDYLQSATAGPVQIMSIETVERVGAFSPLTTTGSLLVNGLCASSYIHLHWVPEWITGDMLHAFEHAGVLPYRLWCQILGDGSCQNETYNTKTGYSSWVQFWVDVETFQLDLSPWGRFVLLVVLFVPLVLVLVAGQVVMLLSPMNAVVVATTTAGCFVGGTAVTLSPTRKASTAVFKKEIDD